MTSFKEWVRKKTEDAALGERTRLREDWAESFDRLKGRIIAWLEEDGEGKIVISQSPVERSERGLGSYELSKLRIGVGDDSVELVPMGRHVIASLGLRGEAEHRGAGRVDLTNGTRKYSLYRTIQNVEDVWYVVDERSEVSLLTKERFLEIVMDLMS